MEEDKMEEKKDVAEQPTRFTYEQLEQIAGNLSTQVQSPARCYPRRSAAAARAPDAKHHPHAGR